MSPPRTPRTRQARVTRARPVEDSALVAFLRPLVPFVVDADRALALAQTLEHELQASAERLRTTEALLADLAELGQRARPLSSSSHPPQTPEAQKA